MISLDCESRETALASVSVIYCVSKRDVEQFLQKPDLEKHWVEGERLCPFYKELPLLFKKEFACSPVSLDRVFWFHFTRTKSTQGFTTYGILPLTKTLDYVWETILDVFKGTEHEKKLQSLRSKGIYDFRYREKVSNPFHAGPYAMLIRDTASRSKEMGNYDYLQLPEIMADICNGYSSQYGEMIDQELSQALTPYVVKFWSCNQTGEHLVESALYYLYRLAHDQPLSIDANNCFDGKNSLIPPEQIDKIEPF